MADDTNPTATAALSPSALSGAAQEDEVYGLLGALLGTLEVVATDESHPVGRVQEERLRSALGLCSRLQTYIESLLTLSADDLDRRLRRSHSSVRPLVEHAVRGAVRRFEAERVSVRMPATPEWGEQRVFVDASRVDRALRALAEALADRVGAGGAIEVSVSRLEGDVVLALRGRARAESGPRQASPGTGLLERAARYLLELHGGRLSLDPARLGLEVRLPVSEGA